MASIHRAHRAFIFAVAQLSCYYYYRYYDRYYFVYFLILLIVKIPRVLNEMSETKLWAEYFGSVAIASIMRSCDIA